MNNGLINATELAYKVGKSIQTISSWYKFKEENPDNEYSHMLPDYIRIGAKRTRYWREADVEKLIVFYKTIPQGRNGVLGSVTQRYVGKKGNSGTVTEASKPKVDSHRLVSKSYIIATEELLLKNGVELDTVNYVIKVLKEERSWRASLTQKNN